MMKILISTILVIFGLTAFAQNQNLITFEYDEAGNRVKRHANVRCEDIKIHNQPFTISHNLYKANNYIESTLMVNVNDTLNYEAEEEIILTNGFEVKTDATFEAKIEECISEPE